MTSTKLFIAFPFVLPFAAFAQPGRGPVSDRIFTLANKPPAAGLQELLTTLRTVGHIQTVSADPVASTVSVSAPSGDIAVAQWIVDGLDQPVTPDATNKQIRDTAVRSYTVPGAKDDVLRIFYLSNVETPQNVQELITALRTVGQIKYIYNYTPLHALTVRGTADEIAMSAWMIDEIDQPPNVRTEGIHQFQSSDPKFPLVRAFYLAHRTQKDIQETLTSLRRDAHIQRAFSHTARAVIIIAGTPAEVEQSSRLVAEKDRPVASATP
jgi:hypothetical protein